MFRYFSISTKMVGLGLLYLCRYRINVNLGIKLLFIIDRFFVFLSYWTRYIFSEGGLNKLKRHLCDRRSITRRGGFAAMSWAGGKKFISAEGGRAHSGRGRGARAPLHNSSGGWNSARCGRCGARGDRCAPGGSQSSGERATWQRAHPARRPRGPGRASRSPCAMRYEAAPRPAGRPPLAAPPPPCERRRCCCCC